MAQNGDVANANGTLEFKADVARLLHLMVHSVYSERDIFLRELISNGADACEKLRYEANLTPELLPEGGAFKIRIEVDRDKKILSVIDNGIGMSREDLENALGTIASSGTRAFLERVAANAAEGKPSPTTDLIGQFGIGFYSAFMVASRVDVKTRRAGSDKAYLWHSDGLGTYVIEDLSLDEASVCGTRIDLHLKGEAETYLDASTLERIISAHSSAIAIPVVLAEEGSEERSLTDGVALWAKNKSEISEEEYAEFYRNFSGNWDEPALTLHWRAEGRHEYSVLAFLPSTRPFDLFEPERKGHSKLYVRRVLITQDAEVLPPWLRFVKVVVDSADLPLNVSREMIQKSPVFEAIRKGVTNRVVQELTKLAEKDPQKFAVFWDNFGAVFKEGLYEDRERRDALLKIARFQTNASPDSYRTLVDYVADFRPNQTAIYYLTGDDKKRLIHSPQLEGFKKRGLEVLLLTDPVDAFWIGSLLDFEGKPFKSVAQGSADLGLIPALDADEDKKQAEAASADTSVFERMKSVLGDAVNEVRASDRLTASPSCLVMADSGFDRQLQRMLAAQGRGGPLSQPVLEVNAKHPLILGLSDLFEKKDDARAEDLTWLVFDQAKLVDGEKPTDANEFAARLTRLMTQAVA